MALAYTAPTWQNGGGVGISASQLQALSDCMEGLVQGSDKAITNISISGQIITLTFADGSQEAGTASGLKGISSIAKTGTSGLVDTYTITFTDGSTSTFTVTNGAQGEAGPAGPQGPQGEQGIQGPAGADGEDGVSPEVTITAITGGHKVTITDANHPTGQDFDVMDGANTVVPNPQGTSVGDLTSIGINGDKYDIPGGGGASALTNLTDVNISNPTDGQLLQYDASSQKWINKYFKAWLVPWSTGTDEQITQMIHAYYNGDITLQDVKSVWSLGQVREIDISAIAASGGSGTSAWSVNESHRAQTVKVQIIDFDHDTLVIPINGITKALITVDIKDMLVNASCPVNDYSQNTERGYMSNTTSNVGGWGSSARRAWCNNAFYNALPTYMKNLVKTVVKSTSAGNKSSTIVTTNDDIFLASSSEHYADNGQGIAGEGTLYKLFETQSNLIKLPDYSIASSTYISGAYWERNPLVSSNHHFCRVGALTADSADVTNEVNGIAPCWCM